MQINIEKVYLNIILGSLSFMFFLWFFVNYFKVSSFAFKFIILVLSYYIWYILLRNKEIKLKKTDGILHHIVLYFLLVIVFLFWLIPVIINPNLPLGRGYVKPVHDGLSMYFSRGNLPMFGAKMSLDYANEMHLLAAFFSFFKFPLFHLNLAATLFAILINSLTTYLILLELYRHKWFSTLFAGISGLISYKLPFLYYLSTPMLFSLLLVLPCLYLFYLSQKEKKLRFYIAFGIAIGALTACYNGTSVIFYPLIFLGLISERLIFKKRLPYKNILLAIFISFIFFFIAVARQGEVYYQNLTEDMNDCNDASHYMLPFIDPIFFIFFLPALILFLINKKYHNKLGIYILISIFILMLFVPYYWLFNLFNGKINNYQDCINAPNKGIFSIFNHEKVHRYAFMQPIIFILVLPAFSSLFKNKKLKIFILILMILILLFCITQVPLYWIGGYGGTINLSELKSVKIKNLRFTAPLLLVELSYIWVERGWSDELRDKIFYLYDKVNETNKLVYVVYNEDNYISISKRYMLYLFFNRNYKYVLNPKKFFEKEVYRYKWVITEPCSNEIPMEYHRIYKSENICIFKHKDL